MEIVRVDQGAVDVEQHRRPGAASCHNRCCRVVGVSACVWRASVPVGVTDIALGAVVVAALGVDGVGVLAPGIEFLAGGGRRLAMGCGCFLQPGRFRRLHLGLGFRGPRLGLRLVGERLALLDALRFLSDLLANALGLGMPPPVARSTASTPTTRDHDDAAIGDDDPDHGVGSHVRSFARSGPVR